VWTTQALGLAAVLAVFAGCTTAAPRPVPAERLESVSTEVVAFDGPIGRLSPDGDTLVWRRGDEACARSVTDGQESGCVTIGSGPDLLNLAWSPDGSRVAITEEGHGGEDSDLWVWTPRTGELSALTDDGAAGVAGEQAPIDTPVDILPAWSPDGSRIAFARLTHDTRTFALWTIASDGSDERLVTVVSEGQVTVRQGIKWVGDRIFYTTSDGEDGTPGGVHVVGVDGTGSRLLSATDADRGSPLLDAVTPDGARVLACYYDLVLGSLGGRLAGEATHAVVDVATGDAMLLDRLRPDDTLPEGSMSAAALSPDGSKIAYAIVPTGTIASPALVVRDVAGGPEALLVARVDGASRFAIPWLEWPTMQTITIPGEGGLILVRLGERPR
jgi:dipeptidyl aminopeptidase/acylaminoacyl peptidase